MDAASQVCRDGLDPIMVVCAILAVRRAPCAVRRAPCAVRRVPIVITRACLRINLARLSYSRPYNARICAMTSAGWASASHRKRRIRHP